MPICCIVFCNKIYWLFSSGDDENVKKHKRKRHLEDSESTDVVVKDEQVDWVTVKHRKKHKIHKRHSIKER